VVSRRVFTSPAEREGWPIVRGLGRRCNRFGSMRRRGLAGVAAIVMIGASLLTPSTAWASANANGNADRNVNATTAGTTTSRAAGLATSESSEATEAGRARGAVQGLPYVALGDSYAAGFGVGPVSGGPVPGCDQSAADYPHLVAQQLGLRLKDVSCAGAVTANLISTPQLTGDGTAPPQISGLGASTRIVTVTIGGNDLGFASIASSCVALSPTGPVIADPQFTTCKALYDTRGVDSLVSRLDGPVLYGSPGAPNGLTATFAAIRKAAPHAKVFVVGYPAIAPDASNTPAAGCFRPAAQPDAKPPYPQGCWTRPRDGQLDMTVSPTFRCCLRQRRIAHVRRSMMLTSTGSPSTRSLGRSRFLSAPAHFIQMQTESLSSRIL
jgi:hypothetical protein